LSEKKDRAKKDGAFRIMLKSIGRKGVALVDVACLKSFPKPSNPLSGAAMSE
jgi:hypothetical protein